MDDTQANDRPTLLKDRSFWGLAITQFLGAFNDNVFKQLVLLLALGSTANITQDDLQGWATFIFSLPFVLFSG
ncbi:MAG: MFS transporter, partial [Planctomycetota bacterium]